MPPAYGMLWVGALVRNRCTSVTPSWTAGGRLRLVTRDLLVGAMEEERHGLISACLSRGLALSVVSEAMSSRRSGGP